jgi:hypothetical protein
LLELHVQVRMKPSLISVVYALILGIALSFKANPLYAQDRRSADATTATDVGSATSPTDAAADTQGDQVLEVPQVAVTNDQSNADAESPDDAADVADSADSPADASEYANQAAGVNAMPELPNSPSMVTAYPPIVVYPASPVRNYSTYVPPGIIIARPGGLNSIPATSPMLTTPRGSHPMMGGWWQRARR